MPWGFRKLLGYSWKQYASHADVPIRIFENGYAIDGEENLLLEQVIHDTERQEYYNGYIQALCDTILEDGAKIDTYLAWSLLE